ncbi:glycosyltransferase family 39 protein [bacterium]|nr:glycosyltransferase family 39 protein [bacterium]
MQPKYVRTLLQLLITAGLLALARKQLLTWYAFQHKQDYLIFILLIVSALLLNVRLVSNTLRSHLRDVPRGRWIGAAPLLFLCLPWPDWLQINELTYEYNWHLELFHQAVFLYSAFLLFSAFASLRNRLWKTADRLIGALCRWRGISGVLCFFFFCACSWIALFVFDRTLLNTDSAAHFFQAKIFSHYRSYAPAPSPLDFFTFDSDELVVKEGRWFGMFLPGFAMMLGAALKARAEWLLCPLLGALSLAIWSAYAKRWYGERPAIWLALLAITSPFLLVMFSVLMVQVPELFFCSAVIYLCRRETEETSALRLCGLFLCLISAVLVRGFSMIPFLAPILAYVAWKKIQMRSLLFPIVIISGIVAGVAFLSFFNWKTTGDPLVPGYTLELNMKYGFSEMVGRTHTVSKGLENSALLILGLNLWLTGFVSGAIFFLIFFLMTSKQIDLWDKLLFSSFAILIVFYFFYYNIDLIYGPRFLFPVALFLLLFLARHIHENSTVAAVFILFLMISPFLRLQSFLEKCSPSIYQNGPLQSEINRLGNQKTLVFLRPEINQEFISWNDPFLKAPVILCRDLDERNQEVIARFPQHQPSYFGLQVHMEKTQMVPEYRVTKERSKTSRPISLMQLAMFLRLSQAQHDKDIFDIQYMASISPSQVASQLAFLNQEQDKLVGMKDYARDFKAGLILTSKFLLAARMEYYNSGDLWTETLDFHKASEDFRSAIQAFERSGDIGKPVMGALHKVFKRVDQNDDQQIADAELRAYLEKKIQVLRIREYRQP